MSKTRPRQIPLPGGSGEAPTGAVQFQDDWPGLFVRGDEAVAGIAPSVRALQKKLRDHTDPEIQHALRVLGFYADIIDRDVKV